MKIPLDHVAYCVPCAVPYQVTANFTKNGRCPACGTVLTLYKVRKDNTINLSNPVVAK